MTTHTISAMKLRDRIGDVLNRVRYAGERFIVERRGQPVAAIISVEDLQLLERLEEERDAELLRLAKATSEGVVPFETLIEQYEALHGEPLETPANV